MPMRSRKFTRDNGDEIEIDFSYRILRGPTLEIEEYKAWLWIHRNNAGAPDLRLTDAEFERFDELCCADDSLYEVDCG